MELRIDNVSKTYNNGHRALSNFSLTLTPGVTGLLGPNGAGKSTLMRIISTITEPTSGKVSLNGIDLSKSPDAIRDVLGYLPQDFGVYPKLTARQYLQYIGALKGLGGSELSDRIEMLLEMVNLGYVEKNRKLSQYSGGMRQRVGIAQALLNDPKILIVDEPTVGLDPQERARFTRLLTEMAEDRIVILSTHIVSDIEATASKVAIIKEGKNVAFGSPEDILEDVEGNVYHDMVSSEQFKELQVNYLVTSTKRVKEGVSARFIVGKDQKPFNNATIVMPSLEEAYLYHVN